MKANLVARMPKVELKVLLAAAALLFLGVALHEHDQWIRERDQLENVERQARQQAAQLAARAQSAERAAAEASAHADSLELARASIEQRNRDLNRQLAALTLNERRATEQVATLPTRDVVARVAALLGNDATPSSKLETPNSNPALGLTGAGARKVETAFVELDACRSERANLAQQVSNCGAENTAAAQSLAAEKEAAAKWHQALAAKDEELQARERAARAELKAARGTFFSRLERTAEHVAVGLGIGVAIGVAAK